MYKLLILIGIISVVAGNLVRIPIYKNEKYTGTPEQLDAEKHVFNQKHIQKKGSKVYENVENAYSNKHYGVVSVGTPLQNLTVIIDSNSAEMWFFYDNTCVEGTSSEEDCPKLHGYNPKDSSTYSAGIDAIYYYYDDQSIVGGDAFDLFKIGNLPLVNQTFSYMTEVNNKTKYWSKMDGLFGLGLLAGYSGMMSPLLNLIRNKVLEERVVSLYLLPDSTSSYLAKGGEVIFGGSDPSLYKGNLTYTNITSLGVWQFNISSISLGGTELSTDCATLIDSTTQYMSAPKSAYDAINKLFGANVVNTTVNVDCSIIATLPDLEILISSRKFTLPASSFILEKTSATGTTCISLIMESDQSNWILSEAFLSRYYTTIDFSNEIIGFAPINIPTVYKPPQSGNSCKHNLN